MYVLDLSNYFIICELYFYTLGHFLLTNLLLDSLKKIGGEENGDARVITVTSSIHDPEVNRRKSKFS